MDGLYALKPWYAHRLAGARRVLVRRNVSPSSLTWGGVGCGAVAGLALARMPYGPMAAVVVAVALAARLAFANLDGGVARERGVTSQWGAVENELGDRLADLLAIGGLLFVAPPWLVLAAALATTMPSWISLAGAAAGAPRLNGGPLGKTERALLLVATAATGRHELILAVLMAGGALTAALRLDWLGRILGETR